MDENFFSKKEEVADKSDVHYKIDTHQVENFSSALIKKDLKTFLLFFLLLIVLPSLFFIAFAKTGNIGYVILIAGTIAFILSFGLFAAIKATTAKSIAKHTLYVITDSEIKMIETRDDLTLFDSKDSIINLSINLSKPDNVIPFNEIMETNIDKFGITVKSNNWTPLGSSGKIFIPSQITDYEDLEKFIVSNSDIFKL